MAKPVPLVSKFDAVKPKSVVAGVGCRRGTSADEIITLIQTTLISASLDHSALVAIATLDRKVNDPGLLAAAVHFGVPLSAFTAEELTDCDAGSSPVLRLVGVPSVAEAAARRAGVLLLPKQKSARATCALAVCWADFDLAAFGQAVPGNAPASTAAMAASRSLTSNAGP